MLCPLCLNHFSDSIMFYSLGNSWREPSSRVKIAVSSPGRYVHCQAQGIPHGREAWRFGH